MTKAELAPRRRCEPMSLKRPQAVVESSLGKRRPRLPSLPLPPCKDTWWYVCRHWYPHTEGYVPHTLNLKCIRSLAYLRICVHVPLYLSMGAFMQNKSGFAYGPSVCPHEHKCMPVFLPLAQGTWICVATRWTHLCKSTGIPESVHACTCHVSQQGPGI